MERNSALALVGGVVLILVFIFVILYLVGFTYLPIGDSTALDSGGFIIPIIMGFLIITTLGALIYYFWRKRKNKGKDLMLFDFSNEVNKLEKNSKKEVELPLFSFASVSAATNNFSDSNLLGRGGFGPVYKGVLLKGDEIAVKRLSRGSGQGLEELKNEALVIAKIQHKNLVRLLGCCIHKDEKILIYEYMPNKSLDLCLFDSSKSRLLDWRIRVRIIEGITQGLLYLHQYSRVRIIHRDLKAGNILLDKNMNPKISDFGMARIFGQSELQVNTQRIAGTYGYISPEYAREGVISVKSDVFSFGVLFLEIVSGKKNTEFHHTPFLTLLGYVWDLWTSHKILELVDPVLDEVPSRETLIRFVNIALLCVEENAEDRPTMNDVVSMLTNESLPVRPPNQPAFSHVRSRVPDDIPRSSNPEKCSANEVTLSILEAR